MLPSHRSAVAHKFQLKVSPCNSSIRHCFFSIINFLMNNSFYFDCPFFTRFHCPACKQKLETGEFSKEELEDLKLSLVKHLWKPHKTLQQLKCFTSAGNFIDYVNSEQLNRIPLSVEHFVKNTGPYDVVIDGLNVGYIKGFFDPRNVSISYSVTMLKKKKTVRLLFFCH